MSSGQRPTAMHDLLRTASQRKLGEARNGEPEAPADEDLGRDRPPPASPWHERERGEATGQEDHPACDAL